MRKVRIFLFLLGLCWFSGQTATLFAQEDDGNTDSDDDYIETDWDRYMPELYSLGDQTFTISLGVIFPALFYQVDNKGNRERIKEHNFSPPVGGTGSLLYTFFLGSNFFLGAEIGMKFNYTLGENVVFIIPIGLRTGVQFIIGRFELPLFVTAGVAPQRYLDYSYAGFFLKAGGSVFFRFNSDWSFGINGDWSWYPERPGNVGSDIRNMDGHIIGVTLSARYHF